MCQVGRGRGAFYYACMQHMLLSEPAAGMMPQVRALGLCGCAMGVSGALAEVYRGHCWTLTVNFQCLTCLPQMQLLIA
jgi:hypothetical protein